MRHGNLCGEESDDGRAYRWQSRPAGQRAAVLLALQQRVPDTAGAVQKWHLLRGRLLGTFREKLLEFLTHGGSLANLPDYVATHFTWDQFFAIQLWILVLFLIYTFISELNGLFGDGELARILFTCARPS